MEKATDGRYCALSVAYVTFTAFLQSPQRLIDVRVPLDARPFGKYSQVPA